jgi:hypothetical protein
MTAEAEKIEAVGMMDVVRAASIWMRAIEDQTDARLSPQDAALCVYLSKDILRRWRKEAIRSAGNEIDGIELFKRVYAMYKDNAQGYIVAVMEQAGKLGRLEQMIDWRTA